MLNGLIAHRLKVLKVFLYICCILILFWWPLSHWLYSDFYHQLMGFTPGSYQDSMVKVIGTCGFLPVMLLFFSAKDPIRNREMIVALLVMSLLLACMYFFLVFSNLFPARELISAFISLFFMLVTALLYPWKQRFKQN